MAYLSEKGFLEEFNKKKKWDIGLKPRQ
jgi:hypothetical protein